MERISFSKFPKGIADQMMSAEAYLKKTTLDVKLLELMRLRVSQINGCPYCVDMHYKLLKHAGETDLRISLLPAWKESGYFTEEECNVLEFAENLTRMYNSEVSEALYTRLKKHFSEDEIADLTYAVSQQNTWNRIVRTFHFEAGHFRVPQEAESMV